MLPRASLIIWHTLQPVEFPQVAEDETPQVAMHDVHRLPRYLFHRLSPPPSTPNKLLQTAEELNDDSLGIGIGTALLRTFVRSLPWTDYVQRKS